MRGIDSSATGAGAVTTPVRLSRQLVRVAIADDHRLMLDGIKRALAFDPDIKVVGEAMTGEALLALVPQVRPDVVMLDMRMPNGDGVATLQVLRKSYPRLKVIMLSMFDDPEHIEEALGLGAVSYLVKSINPLDLPSAIRGAFEGTVYHPRSNAGGGMPDPAPQAMPGGLTIRELTILRLVAQGPSNADIAGTLFVTEQTVKFHLSNIYRKLRVRNRTEATRYAYRHGLVD